MDDGGREDGQIKGAYTGMEMESREKLRPDGNCEREENYGGLMFSVSTHLKSKWPPKHVSFWVRNLPQPTKKFHKPKYQPKSHYTNQ